MSTASIKRLPDAELLEPVTLSPIGNRTPVHVFDQRSVLAVNAALDCGRPLLIRGEPGTGKSQLARAVAAVLEREFVSRVVDARTEPVSLMWERDALRRLGDAQAGMRGDELALANYVIPGPLWWAFAWDEAKAQAERAKGMVHRQAHGGQASGVVVLIDEIDKADITVPNALLESLGHGEFPVPGVVDKVRAHEPHPLVMFTTNTDRVLPDAFVRRCIVLRMDVPEGELFEAYLQDRGRAHASIIGRFPEAQRESVLAAAAKRVADERAEARDHGVLCPPGLAEYIDLLTILSKAKVEHAETRIDELAPFVLRKHLTHDGSHG